MGNMFKTTKAKTPAEYISMLDEPRRSEMKQLHAFIQKAVPRLKPFLLAGMIGYGPFHYKSKSGREGEWARVLLASQKNYISIYVCGVKNGKYVAESSKHLLPKASIGKSCIRIKKIADVDLKNLKHVIIEGAKSPFGM